MGRFGITGALVAALLLCCSGLHAEQPTFPAEIQNVLARAEDSIDIGEAALMLDRQAKPSISVAAYEDRLDDLAAKVKALNERQGGRSYLWSLDAVLKKEGYQFDFAPDAKTHQDNHTLSGLLDSKRGFCDSMTTLYIAVAQRLGLHPFPVLAPQHVFIRYTGLGLRGVLSRATGLALGGDTYNVEATSGGTLTDADYIAKYRIPDKSIKSGAYLRTMSYREYVGLLMVQTAWSLYRAPDRANRGLSKLYFDKAAELTPLAPEVAENLSIVYGNEAAIAARQGNSQIASNYNRLARAFHGKAEALGIIKGDGTP